MRKWLLGINVLPPEDEIARHHQTSMVFYSFYTWIYRLFLYPALALVVYWKFTKVLGVILFVAAIYTLLASPIIAEFKQLKKLWPYIHVNYRSLATLVIIFGLIFWLTVPLPHEESFPGVVVSSDHQILYAPSDAYVKRIYAVQGGQVEKGQQLIDLYSYLVSAKIAEWQVEKEILEKEIYIAGQNDKTKPFIPQKKAMLATAAASLSQYEEEESQLNLKSKINGTIYFWDDWIHAGQAVSKDQILGKIANFEELEIVVFVPERQINDIKIGQNVAFELQGSRRKIRGTVRSIDRSSSDILNYPALASIYGGEIPVAESKGEMLQIVESYYMAYIAIDPEMKSDLAIRQTGKARIRGAWRSIAGDLFENVWRQLLRQTGF